MDAAGRVLGRKRLPEGAAGMAGLHALVGEYLGDGPDAALVTVGIETDRGPPEGSFLLSSRRKPPRWW
jgi:hypothetical protein